VRNRSFWLRLVLLGPGPGPGGGRQFVFMNRGGDPPTAPVEQQALQHGVSMEPEEPVHLEARLRCQPRMRASSCQIGESMR